MVGNLYIRVDGSSDIGLGHLIRCVALAEMLRKLFKIHFVSLYIPGEFYKILESKGFPLIVIKDERSFFRLLTQYDSVILDGYKFDLDYQKIIKDIKCKLICIDDLHDSEFVADMIINHAPGVKPNQYRTPSYTKFALGPKYVLLRPGFLKSAREDAIQGKIESLLICFGGSDIKNLSARTLAVALQYSEFKKITVVTGASFMYTRELNAFIRGKEYVCHYHAIDEDEMIKTMIESDLAIVPASGVLLEALAVGNKVISGMYTDNQKFLYEAFKNSKNFEDASTFEENEIHSAIKHSLSRRERVTRPFDGLSDKRVRKMIACLLSEIRTAVESDIELLFNWANDPLVRMNAINKSVISWQEHCEWFKNKIKSPLSKIFILDIMGVSVGQIRYDKTDYGWIIDYSIDNRYRGMGLGKLLLEKTLSLFNDTIIEASVKQNNLGSCKVFEAVNFEFKEANEIHNDTYKVYRLIL